MNFNQLLQTLRGIDQPACEGADCSLGETDYLSQKIGAVRARDNTTGRSTPDDKEWGKSRIKDLIKKDIHAMSRTKNPALPEEQTDESHYSPFDYHGEHDPDPEEMSGYDRYRAKGGTLSRSQWAFDQSQRNPWDSDDEDEEQTEGMFDKKPNDAGQILVKLAKVVKSVQTPDQLKSAENFANLVFNKLNARIKQDKGFAGLEDSTKLMNQIEADLKAKAREVGTVAKKDKIGMDSDLRTMQKLAGVGESSDEESDEEWYNADGSLNPNGAYDAGGHYYADRDVREGDAGWDDPRYEPRKPEPDEDWEYEKSRDNPRDRYVDTPTQQELDADAEDRAEKAARLKQAMAAVAHTWGRKSKTEGTEEVAECGMMPDMQQSQGQEDTVSMSINMNGTGTGGIRDILNVLRNIEGSNDSITEPKIEPAVKKEPGMDFMTLGDTGDVEKEGFANSPDEVYHDISASTPNGNDLNRAKQSFKHNPLGGDNKMAESIAERLAQRYEEIKSSK